MDNHNNNKNNNNTYNYTCDNTSLLAALPDATIKRLQTDSKYLNQVLSFHVSPGRHKASVMMRGQRFRTLEGSNIRVFIYPWVGVPPTRDAQVDTL